MERALDRLDYLTSSYRLRFTNAVKSNGVPQIVSVQSSSEHALRKTPKDEIQLIEDRGLGGETCAGPTDQHFFKLKGLVNSQISDKFI